MKVFATVLVAVGILVGGITLLVPADVSAKPTFPEGMVACSTKSNPGVLKTPCPAGHTPPHERRQASITELRRQDRDDHEHRVDAEVVRAEPRCQQREQGEL